jgi:hypothetical protein
MQVKELLLSLKKEQPFVTAGTSENVLPLPIEGS